MVLPKNKLFDSYFILCRGFSAKKGEQAFRKWFSRICEIRSLVKGVPIVALTATASKKTKEKIIKALEMENAVIVSQNPNRKNIAYSVQAVSGGANNTFAPFIEDLRKNGTSSERVIIYCQTIKVVSHVYGVFKGDLGGDMYVTQGDPKSSMVEMYHSRIDELNQENIVADLAESDGNIRILISTIAYGMGVNCQGVRTIIHYGPSRNIEAYHQESGRAGRDTPALCTAVMLYSNVMLKYCDDDIKEYAHNNTLCRRAALLLHFDGNLSELEKAGKPHECCDVCQRSCNCNGDSCSFVYFPSLKSSSLSKPALQEREVTCNQHKKLHAKLEYLKTSFSKDVLDIASVKNAALFTFPELLSGFGATQIHQTLTNCQYLFSVADVHKYVDIWDPSVATEIMVAIQQVFGDTNYEDDFSEEEDSNFFSFVFWGSEQEEELFHNLPEEFFFSVENSDSDSEN